MYTEYIIDGAKFKSKNGFYNYIEKHFTQGLSFKIGRNLNAFQDVLSGGFGMHSCDEPITVTWKNLTKSKEHLDSKFLYSVLGILTSMEGVTFRQFDHGISLD
ncbi:hypothetical protein GCM10009122_27440 [Fulvivirga kasyanovii]|uniref:barstar family protein n=1 Tax=Fulvivirga kasyanovii TaxID=396812 RepID=UPI0031D6A056